MRNPSSRRAFSISDLLIVVAIIGILLALLLPAVQAARQAARRTQCANNLRQLSMALIVDDQKNGKLPTSAFYRDDSAVSVKIGTVVPGSPGPAKATRAPFSFHVKLLPYLEQNHIYQRIDFANHEAFHPQNSALAAVQLPLLNCPSFAGPARTNAKDYAANPKPALTQYKSIGATTWTALNDPQATKTDDKVGGAIHPYQAVSLQALGRAGGTAGTVLLCETMEPDYAVWWDGTTASIPGFHPGIDQANKTTTPALNIGAPPFLTKKQFGGSADMIWGPSSGHPAIVNHVFADGHQEGISTGIDAEVYKAAITRASDRPAGGGRF